MRKQITRSVIFLLLIGFVFLTSVKNASIDKPADFQRVYPVQLPADLNFAGESMPVMDYEVAERMDRELTVNTYWQSQTLLSLKLANRYFPVIERILKKNGIPEDFKYMALAESGLRNAVSPANAEGMWQFLKGTALNYGLEVSPTVDERYHLEKSTEAACKYLRQAYNKFGSWTLAAASYNMGSAGIAKQLKKQKATNYYDLYLNEETSRYVFRIVALKEIHKNPLRYGFMIRDTDLYAPLSFKEVAVTAPVSSLIDFAKQNGTNYKHLKLLNPWLKDTLLNASTGKSYVLRLPVK